MLRARDGCSRASFFPGRRVGGTIFPMASLHDKAMQGMNKDGRIEIMVHGPCRLRQGDSSDILLDILRHIDRPIYCSAVYRPVGKTMHGTNTLRSNASCSTLQHHHSTRCSKKQP